MSEDSSFYPYYKAQAHPNIAFIKYWGNRNHELRIPSAGSISMNLGMLTTETSVSFSKELSEDVLSINGEFASGETLTRVSVFLDIIRSLAGISQSARIISKQNFPASAGLASSASAFAALALAATRASGLELNETDLSRLARRGSGSACRSIATGFVEWKAGSSDEDSFAISIAPAEYWTLVDCIAIVKGSAKSTGSSDGHRLASSSLLQNTRIEDAPRRLSLCRQAILQRDFECLAEISEFDSNLMHAVMMTSNPPLFYWEATSLMIMKNVKSWRSAGLPVFYTVDAGPNIHVITTPAYETEVEHRLTELPGVRQVIYTPPGGPAMLLE